MPGERKEAVRAWAYLGPDKDLRRAKLFPDEWRAKAAAALDDAGPGRTIPVEIHPLNETKGDGK